MLGKSPGHSTRPTRDLAAARARLACAMTPVIIKDSVPCLVVYVRSAAFSLITVISEDRIDPTNGCLTEEFLSEERPATFIVAVVPSLVV
jgi:hypothetical protein